MSEPSILAAPINFRSSLMAFGDKSVSVKAANSSAGGRLFSPLLCVCLFLFPSIGGGEQR